MRLSVARAVLSLGAILSLVMPGSVATASGGSIPYTGPVRVDPLNTPAKYLVLMVLDGARPDYFKLGNLPHVNALRAAGTQYTNAFAGILESETPAGHATISTGSTPRHSGILGFSWGQNGHDFSLFSPTVVRSGTIERIMQMAHAPTIAGLYKARFPSAPVVALSGFKYYAADPLGGPQADAIMYLRGTLQQTYAPTAIPGHVPPQQVFNDPKLTVPLKSLQFGQDDGMVTQMALDSFAAMRQRVTLINYPDFDWPLGHVYGGISDRARATTLMQIFDNDLGRIEDAYRKAGILKQTLFVITADHGMMPLRRFVPQTVVTKAITQAGTTSASISWNTATYIWLRNATKGWAVATNIMRSRDPGLQSAYYLTGSGAAMHYVHLNAGQPLSAAEDAAHQYLLSSLMNGHEPTVVVFCRNHATSSAPTTHWKADHGGGSWASQHVPLIVAGPGIKAGQVISLPAQLEDVAPTALVAMGVRPTGMEGHVLTEALRTPFHGDLARRAAEIAQVTPLVRAMIAQDRAEAGVKR